MGCLNTKHSDLSTQTTTLLSHYHLTSAHITKTYTLFLKIQAKHNRTKTPLQLKLAGNRPIIYYSDVRHMFAIPPSLLSAHLLDLVPLCEKEGELSFPEFLELVTVVCLMSREQLLSFGYHAFPVNELDELHISDFVGGLTELKDVYPHIINGADIPVSKLGLLAQTTVDTLLTPHSASATSAATAPPTPHHLTLSTFRQVMLNQPWFIDLLLLIQEQFQRKTRSTREWNNHHLLLKSKDKAVLAAIDDIVRRRTPGSKKGLKTARGSESGASGKHVRRQSTMHARAMERIGRRQSSVLPEIGLQDLRKEMVQLAEEEKSELPDTLGGEQHQAHLSGDESSRSARDGSTHRKSSLRRPSRHALATKRKGSFSNHQDESALPAGSPSLSNRSHRRNFTVGGDEGSLSRGRGASGAESDDGTGIAKGLRQPSQSHSHRPGPGRMRNGRSSMDVGAMDRVQAQQLHTLRRNSTGSNEEARDTEGGKKSSRGTEEIKEAEEEEEERAVEPDVLQPAQLLKDNRSQLGRERASLNSTESGTFRSRTNSGLTRVNERVSREDDPAAASDDTMSPSVKSIPSSPPSRTRPLFSAAGTSPSMPHKSSSHSHSRSRTCDTATDGDVTQTTVRAREKSPVSAQPESPPAAVSQRLLNSVDEQDDQLTRLQAITAQKKLSVSTVHRKSSVARASTDDSNTSDGDGSELPPRRGSVFRDNAASTRSSPHAADRAIGEVLSSNSASPASVPREVMRRRNDSVSREEEGPVHQIRGSVSREHHSPVHSEAYRKELLQDNHGRYGSSPNLRPERISTSSSHSQAALQHTRSVPPSSHHTASPMNPASLRPSISGLSASPYPHSRQASLSMAVMQPMGAWDASGGSMAGSVSMAAGGDPMAGGMYRSSFSGMQSGVVGGGPPAMYGFAPAKMSLSLPSQSMPPRPLHY